MFIDKLITQVKNKQSHVVVGLDPRLDALPEEIKNKAFKQYGETLEGVADAILTFNKEIINYVEDLVVAVKPQIACYEQYGIEGLKAYIETCNYARSKGLLVIGDAKRGDIGTTSKAYANAHLGKIAIGQKQFETFATDATTTNPYLGDDCLKEFMEDIKEREKGMFVLVKTSNPTSAQLQDLESNGKKVYEIVAEMVNDLSKEAIGESGYSSVGAVVGATYPKQAQKLRQLMPKSYFLVPGYGAQGGTAQDVIDCFNEDGLGALISSSRDIIFAYKKKDKSYEEARFGEAARSEALHMRNAINKALEEKKRIL